MKIKYSIRQQETLKVGDLVELAYIPEKEDEEYEWIEEDSLKIGEKYKVEKITNSTLERLDEKYNPKIELEGKIYWHESRLFKLSQCVVATESVVIGQY